MEKLKEKLTTPGTKVKLVFPTAVRERFERECGFTDEEITILRLLGRGKTALETSFIMEEETGKMYGVEKVDRRIRSIKNKISAIL